MPEKAILSWDGGSVEFDGGTFAPQEGLYIAKAGVEGYYSTPALKVNAVERSNGDGTHRVAEEDIHYAARTVLVHYLAFGEGRARILDALESLARAAHKLVRFRLLDGGRDTYVEGYTSWNTDPGFQDRATSDHVLTIVCSGDPRRYSSTTRGVQLLPAWSGNGGLYYGAQGSGLQYSLTYGTQATGALNIQTLENMGTATAYPIITAYGHLDSVRIDWDGKTLEYRAPVDAVPLILDCNGAGAASMGGVDVSRNLSYRAFPTIPSQSTTTFILQSSGTGFVNVESHDTYL